MRVASVLAVILAAATAAAADQPLSLSHQGRLLDGNDNPVSDAGLAMKFEVFAEKLADTGQTPLWSGSCPVTVTHGLYAVTLGADCGTNLTSAALPFGQARYLQVSVGTLELQPRLRLGIVPAAALAGDALAVGGLAPSALWTKAEAVNAATLGNKAPDDFWKKAEAVNAATLGNKALGDVWTKADAVDAATLGGRSLGDLDSRYVQAQGGSGGSVSIAGPVTVQSLATTGAVNAGSLTSSGALNGASAAISGSVTAQSFSGDGRNVANLDADKLASGTVADARLPTNLARTDATQTFSQPQTFGALTAGSIVSNAGIRFGDDGSTCSSTNAGTLRWTGSALELCVANAWTPIALGKVGSGTNPGRSCKAVLDGGGAAGDGSYWIDPDGAGGAAPMQVYCDMTSYGGGWTRCLASHYWTGAKPPSWVKANWLVSQWQNGTSSVFDNTSSGSNFGNFCTLLASFSTQIYGEATYATSIPRIKTEALALPSGFFASGSQARAAGSGTNAIAIDSANQGRYSTACSGAYTANTTQGIQSFCINDASHQQTMHTGWATGTYAACPESSNQPCYCTQDVYCGGSDLNEQKITMVAYLR